MFFTAYHPDSLHQSSNPQIQELLFILNMLGIDSTIYSGAESKHDAAENTAGLDSVVALKAYIACLDALPGSLSGIIPEINDLKILFENALIYQESEQKIRPESFTNRILSDGGALMLALAAQNHMISISALQSGQDVLLTLNNAGYRSLSSIGVKAVVRAATGQAAAIKVYQFKNASEAELRAYFSGIQSANGGANFENLEQAIKVYRGAVQSSLCCFTENLQEIGNCSTEACRRGIKSMLILLRHRESKLENTKQNIKNIEKRADIDAGIIQFLIQNALIGKAKNILAKFRDDRCYNFSQVEGDLDRKSLIITHSCQGSQKALRAAVKTHNDAQVVRRDQLKTALEAYRDARQDKVWFFKDRRALKLQFVNHLIGQLEETNHHVSLQALLDASLGHCNIQNRDCSTLLAGFFRDKLHTLLVGHDIDPSIEKAYPLFDQHGNTGLVKQWDNAFSLKSEAIDFGHSLKAKFVKLTSKVKQKLKSVFRRGGEPKGAGAPVVAESKKEPENETVEVPQGALVMATSNHTLTSPFSGATGAAGSCSKG